jgi:hypothetical protein
MKKAWVAMGAGMALLLAQGVARADVFSVTADIPMQLTLKFDGDKVGNSVSGYIVGVSLPFLVGFGYENYTASLDKKDVPVKTDYKVQFFDVFLNLPIPVVNIVLGAGLGTAQFDPDDLLGPGTKIKDANLTQYLVSVGIPIAVLFDVHLGYRTFSGTHDTKPGSGSFDTKGQLISLGAKVGF